MRLSKSDPVVGVGHTADACLAVYRFYHVCCGSACEFQLLLVCFFCVCVCFDFCFCPGLTLS